MSGDMILFLVVFCLVMLGWLVVGLWALSQLSKSEPGPIGRAVIDAAWRVLRWWRNRKAGRHG